MILDPFLSVPLRARATGLSRNSWISDQRVAVQMDDREQFGLDHIAWVSVEDDTPQLVEGSLDANVLEAVRDYIVLNRQAILDHATGLTDSAELIHRLQPPRR